MPNGSPGVPVLERVTDETHARALSLDGLSEFFDPFLRPFLLDTLRSGGEAWVSRSGERVDGLFLYLEAETFGTIFTHDPAVADAFSTFHVGRSIYTAFPFGPFPEPFGIFVRELEGGSAPHRFRHAVRLARESDQAETIRLMRDVHGEVNEPWHRRPGRNDEACVVVDGMGELAGVAWVSVANGHGRLHSLSVRPRYRRTGVGTDLWHARALWAASAGARRLVTEISDQNAGSRALSERAGMRRVGEIYRCMRV
jgi:RimJ/RimL family protein N-acetyltransferase